MNDVRFGYGKPFTKDKGEGPSVGMNRRGNVVIVHEAPGPEKRKHHQVGRLNHATIDWGPSNPDGHGVTPRVALNNHDIAVEVHKNEQRNVLYCRAGKLHSTGVSWPNAEHYAEGANRARPVVAVNDAGVVVEEHEVHEGGEIWLRYSVGRVVEAGRHFRVEWSGRLLDHNKGQMPGIALNNHGKVVEVRAVGSDRHLYYSLGDVKGARIDFVKGPVPITVNGVVANGHYPSVALTDDGFVVVVLRDLRKVKVIELTGRVKGDGKEVTWERWVYFDDGTRPSVAAAGKMAVEVHQHEKLPELRFSTSLITDRARWMQNRLSTLAYKRLPELVLPASHDAGMYLPIIPAIARNQSMSILEQLRYGIRYFDLRPHWIDRHWVIHHGITLGPSVQTVLNDVREFASKHRELIILRFSHFTSGGDHQKLIDQIRNTIGPWLVTSLPAGKRLADLQLIDYIMEDRSAILVVTDPDLRTPPRGPNPKPVPGIWTYRDWHAPAQRARGDLRVFDHWSNVNELTPMRRDQLRKFGEYNGRMQNVPTEPCDLFLLSWTLTPKLDQTVLQLARLANPSLGEDIRFWRQSPRIPNGHGKIINMLYVDFVEGARVTDVALFLNGESTSSAAEAAPRQKAKAKAPAKAKAKATATTRRAKAPTRRRVKAAPRKRTNAAPRKRTKAAPRRKTR